MQHLQNLSHIRTLDKRHGAIFNPASIQSETLLFRSGGLTGTALLNKLGDETRPVQAGRCYDFDGVNDYVTLPESDDWHFGTGDFVIEWSMDVDTVATFDRVINYRSSGVFTDGFQVWLKSDLTTVSFYIGSTDSTYNFTTSGYSSAVKCKFERIGGELYCYIDDVQQGSAQTASGSIPGNATYNLDIGRNPFGGNYIDGKMWGLKITKGTDDVLFLKMDEQDGTISYDSSGNGNHGTITNATLSTFHATQNVYSFQNEVGYNLANYYNGSSAYSEIEDDAFITESQGYLELEFVTGSDVTNPQYIFACASDTSSISVLGFRINAGKFSVLDTTSRTATGDTTIETNTYYKVKVETDNSNYVITVNGVVQTLTLVGTNTGNWFDHISGVARFGFGSMNRSSGFIGYFKGSIIGGVLNDGTGDIAKWTVGENGNLIDSIGGKDAVSNSNVAIMYTPRDESDITNDVLGNPLQYSGKAKLNGKLEQSYCGTFDGVNDHVSIPEVTLTGDFTIGGRFNHDVFSAADVLIGGASTIDWSLLVDSTNFYIRINSSQISAAHNQTLSTGVDYHYTVKREGSTITWYVNGIQVATGTLSGTHKVSALGSYDGGLAPFDGKMYGSYIYSRALSDSEITNIVGGISMSTDDLEGYYPIAEGFGVTIHDVSGNGNHGTATNVTEASFWGTKQDVYHYNITEGFSKRMYFNGSDTYVRLDSNPFANKSNIYVEAEYLPNNISDSDCIVGSWATDTNMSLLLFTASGGELRCRVKNTSGTVSSDATATGVLQANVKAKVAVRYDGTDIRLFVNDVQVGSTVAFTGNINTGGSSNPEIGRYSASPGTVPHGTLYDVKISSADKTTVYHEWKGDGNSNSDWEDQVGSNDGTVFGSPSIFCIPALSDKSADAVGSPINNPAIAIHNGAETTIDFKNIAEGGVAPPALSGVASTYETYEFGDTAINPFFKRVVDASNHEDRFLIYENALSGDDLTTITNYTT